MLTLVLANNMGSCRGMGRRRPVQYLLIGFYFEKVGF